MKNEPDTRITRGTKNVFADLGFPDAETHLLKAELVTRIQGVITAQELTQVAAAKRMGLSQPDVARLLNGQFRNLSVERLMRLLTRLGCDVDITIRKHRQAPQRFRQVCGPADGDAQGAPMPRQRIMWIATAAVGVKAFLAMLTHPIDDEAAKYHGKFGFIASPLRDQQLLLLLQDAHRWVR